MADRRTRACPEVQIDLDGVPVVDPGDTLRRPAPQRLLGSAATRRSRRAEQRHQPSVRATIRTMVLRRIVQLPNYFAGADSLGCRAGAVARWQLARPRRSLLDASGLHAHGVSHTRALFHCPRPIPRPRTTPCRARSARRRARYAPRQSVARHGRKPQIGNHATADRANHRGRRRSCVIHRLACASMWPRHRFPAAARRTQPPASPEARGASLRHQP